MRNAPSHNPIVSVIIPTYNDWDLLLLCLQALERQTAPKESFEVIVINNNPNNAPPEAVLQHKIRLLTEARPGSYASRNTGIQAARGELLAFTDSDCIPSPHWIEAGISTFAQFPGTERIGGNVQLFSEGAESSASLFEKVFAFRQSKHVEKGYAVTANMWARRDLFKSVGNFNSSLMSGGDVEWGLRSASHGHSIIYSPDVLVHHPVRSTFKALKSKKIRVYHGAFIKRHSERAGGIKSFVLTLSILRPPLPPILEVYRFPDLSAIQKLKVLGLIFVFRFIRFHEHLRLHAGKPPNRN